MKKLFTLLFALIVSFSLVACNKDDKKTENDDNKTVEEETKEEVKYDTIATVNAGKVGTTYTIKGIITATKSENNVEDSFIITDATGSAFCYDKLYAFALGDEVVLTVKRSEHDGFPQIAEPKLVGDKKTGQDYVAISGTPTELTAAGIQTELANKAEFISKYYGKFLSVKGFVVEKKSKSGNSYYLSAAAGGDKTVKIYFTEDLSSFVGKEITLKGFLRGVSDVNCTIQVQSKA